MSPSSTAASSPASSAPSSTTYNAKQPAESSFDLSTSRLLLAHLGAALALFLATTDATIVSTSLPTITQDLRASESDRTWIVVSYLITQTALQPVYARLPDLVGRKSLCHAAIAIFAVGSVLCGAAKDGRWLIAARALAGVGAGGIVSSAWTITAQIVPMSARPKWSQALSVTWACSAVAGPLLGGVFSGKVSWRWAFWINVPICVFASSILALSLRGVHLVQPRDTTWRRVATKFDFIGLLLFMTGSTILVVGFTMAASWGWTSAPILCLLIGGVAAFVCGGVYELRTTRDALFSATTFRDPSAGIILAVVFLHNFAFNAGTYYLSLFFQAVGGRTPLQAGLQLLPYSLGSSLSSMPAAWFINAWQQRTRDTSGQKWVTLAGLLIATVGFGLMNIMNERSTLPLQYSIACIAGVGIGMLFHAPYQVFMRLLGPNELSSGTSAFFLVRFTGATVGLAIAGAVFDSRFARLLPPGLNASQFGGAIGWGSIRSIHPPALEEQVVAAIANSLRTVWTVCAPCLGLAALLTLLLRVLPLDESPSESKEDAEKSGCSVSSTTTVTESSEGASKA